VTIQLARTRSEFESAFRLLQRSRETMGLERHEGDKLWLLKQHALPSTNTVVALQAGKVVGAVCLFGESPLRLPIETRFDLASFRKNLEGRIAEVSLPAIDPDFAASQDLLLALYHFAVCFGTSYCHYDGLVTEATTAWSDEFAGVLGFEKIFEPNDGRQPLFLQAREADDFRERISQKNICEYHFPEKKFFLVAHQSMSPDVLNYFFNVRTKLFSTLERLDLRVLKNVYDYGEYAKALPQGEVVVAGKKSPRHPRFPMNCEGFLVNEKGQQVHVQVIDVGRGGLKIRTVEPLDKHTNYVLTLFVGVNKKTELIASAVWCDDASEMAGLELRSSDENWAQLIEYLERDFLRVA
jgi:hypothetical protein